MADRDMTQAERDTLEGLLDKVGLGALLEGLSEVLEAKADHLLSNWSDGKAARAYQEAAGYVGVTRCSRYVQAVSLPN